MKTKHCIIPNATKDQFLNFDDQKFGLFCSGNDLKCSYTIEEHLAKNLGDAIVFIANPSKLADLNRVFNNDPTWVVWHHFGHRDSQTYRRWEIESEWSGGPGSALTVLSSCKVYPYSQSLHCEKPWDVGVRAIVQAMLDAGIGPKARTISDASLKALDQAHQEAKRHFDLPVREVVEFAFPLMLYLQNRNPGFDARCNGGLQTLIPETNRDRVLDVLTRWENEVPEEFGVGSCGGPVDSIKCFCKWFRSIADCRAEGLVNSTELGDDSKSGFLALLMALRNVERERV